MRNGEKYGFIDRSGELTIPLRYEQAHPFSENRAAVKVSDRWGYIDRNGQLIVRPTFEAVSDFEKGLGRVVVTKGEDEEYGYVDKSEDGVWYPTN